MNIYEDKYLREKVNRIIARQKEGKIVIAACKDGQFENDNGKDYCYLKCNCQ